MNIISIIISFILVINLMNTMPGGQLYDDCSNACYTLFGPKDGILIQINGWKNYYGCLMYCLHREPWS